MDQQYAQVFVTLFGDPSQPRLAIIPQASNERTFGFQIANMVNTDYPGMQRDFERSICGK
ncbi:MAG TPA: hypothetical protein VMV97_09110 [Sulfuriferula sp.]|nr:hypothetical protein [Sulfuriferula sp.]